MHGTHGVDWGCAVSVVSPPKGTRCYESQTEMGCTNEAVAYVILSGEALCAACVKAISEKVDHTCDAHGCSEPCAGPLDGAAYCTPECSDADERSSRNQ